MFRMFSNIYESIIVSHMFDVISYKYFIQNIEFIELSEMILKFNLQ